MSDTAEIFDFERENIADNSQSLVKCAICQDVIAKNNISYVDLCMHQYCFDCLKQWCEVKAECPLCKQKIEKIFHSVKSPQTYKEFVPAPTNGQLLRVQSEDSFDFNQTFDSDNDTLLLRPSSQDAFIRMLRPVVRQYERQQSERFNTTSDALSSDSSEPSVIESNDESDVVESDEEPEMNSRDESNEESDVSIIESQQSIISISSDSDSEVGDVLFGLRQSVSNERSTNVTRFLLNRVISTPSPPSTPSTPSTQSLYFSPPSSPDSW